jgi:TonB family protein
MRAVKQIRSGLIELRTNRGFFYVKPSFPQRLYLLWTFRNFRRLPLQVLNSHEQQLIHRLCRTAIVAKQDSVARSSLIGSVENINLQPIPQKDVAVTPGNLVAMGIHEPGLLRAVGSEVAPRVVTFPGKSHSSESGPLLQPESKAEARPEEPKAKAFAQILSYEGSGKWLAMGLLLAWGLALVFAHLRADRRSIHKSAPQAVAAKARNISPPNTATATIPIPQKAGPSMLAKADTNIAVPSALRAPVGTNLQQRQSVVQNASIADNAIQRPSMAEWPISGFRYPIAPDPSLTGTVMLTAVVGTDGTVKNIDIISGNRLLAQSAVEAARHWRYAPHEISGNAVEAQTKIVIDFHGEDAVSVRFAGAN